jgi:hypothetical protein
MRVGYEVRHSLPETVRWVAVCDLLPGTLRNGDVSMRLNI